MAHVRELPAPSEHSDKPYERIGQLVERHTVGVERNITGLTALRDDLADAGVTQGCLDRRVPDSGKHGAPRDWVEAEGRNGTKSPTHTLVDDEQDYRGSPARYGSCGARSRFRGGAANSRSHQPDARRRQRYRGCRSRHLGTGSPALGRHGAWVEPAAPGYSARLEGAAKARPHDIRPETQVTPDRARTAVLTLLSQRNLGATVCPSEVAREIASGDKRAWRFAMPLVHDAADQHLDQGLIRLSWKGRKLSARSGPYRIGRANEY